jgi:photosystem II stability/assembly factor-like uncharacterized protein
MTIETRSARKMVAAVFAVALATALPGAAAAAGFVDVLDAPALVSPLSSKVLLEAVARAGKRLVAVGQRGDIVVSDDAGATWKQSPVPVSSDLTAVWFVDANNGWAVGHDGVVLHTGDGGDTWKLQFDGRRAAELTYAMIERKAAADPGSDNLKKLLAEATRDREQGPDKPFLDVWFANANDGYIVGAYNLIFHTADGGKTWESWFDRTDNPKFFNLYGIRPAAGELYIAGEGGLVMRLDPATQRFVAVQVPYNGSFFGVMQAGNAALVFGLRGHVLRSDDGGRTWTPVDAGLPAAVVAAARGTDGATLLADADGRVVSSVDDGRTFTRLPLGPALPLTGLVVAGAGRFAMTGPRGVRLTSEAR